MKVTMRVNGAERSGDVEPRVLLDNSSSLGGVLTDPFQVDWAIAFRMQPAEDVRIVRDTDPITLDPSQPLKDGKPVLPAEQVSSKLGIDATRKHPYPAPSVPPQEHLDKVAALWERYGIREVRR